MRGKFGAIILTDQQEAWLLKHFKHTKNEDIAKKLGVSPRSVNRLAGKRGYDIVSEEVGKGFGRYVRYHLAYE